MWGGKGQAEVRSIKGPGRPAAVGEMETLMPCTGGGKLQRTEEQIVHRELELRDSLAVQWLELHASTAGDTGSIPGQGTKIPHHTWCSKKKKELELNSPDPPVLKGMGKLRVHSCRGGSGWG